MDKILIVEDFKTTREWLCELVSSAYPDSDISGVATCQAAINALTEGSYNMALIDMGLPDGTGLDILEFISERKLQTLPVMATIFDDEEHILSALKAGAKGYILKDDTEEKIKSQIREASRGGVPMSNLITKRLVSYFNESAEKELPVKRQSALDSYALTKREVDVLQLLAKGLKTSEVASALEIAPSTVAGYIKIIYQKLDVSSRAEAAIVAKELGII